jgi:hypothetical protein
MRLLPFMFLMSIFAQFGVSADDTVGKSREAEYRAKLMVPPLLNEDRFVIYYVFDRSLSSVLKETVTKQLQKIGIVYPSGDSELSEKEKQDKFRTGGMIIQIYATQIAEENITPTSNYRILPVFEVSVKVIGGGEILKNGSLFPITIWEKEQFIGVTKQKQEFIGKTVKAMDRILELFVQEYQKANPRVDEKKPQFFFYD